MTATAVPPLADTALYLVVATGAHRGSMIPVKGPQFLIGKHAACHMRPSSTAVSNHHCGLMLREGRTFLCDLNSATGTYLNDRQVVGEVEVLDQDRLRIGPLEFVIRLASAPTANAAEQSAPALQEVVVNDQEEEIVSDVAVVPEDNGTDPIPMDEDEVGLTTAAPAESELAAEPPPPPDPAPAARSVAPSFARSHRI